MVDRNGATNDVRRRERSPDAGSVGFAGRSDGDSVVETSDNGTAVETSDDGRIGAHGREAGFEFEDADRIDPSDADRSRERKRTDSPDPGSFDEHVPAHPGVLVAPATLALGYLGVGAVVGPGVFETDAGGSGVVLAASLLGTLLLVSGYSLARLYDDARWVSSRATDWTPDPWRHLFGGAAVLVVLGAARLRALGVAIADPVGYFGGIAVVALVLSPIVAGPAYAVQRRRRYGRF